jgi:cytochrome c2
MSPRRRLADLARCLAVAAAVLAACTADRQHDTPERSTKAVSTTPVASASPTPGAAAEPGSEETFWSSMPADPGVGADRFEKFGCALCHAVGGAEVRGAPDLGRADLRSSFLEGTARMWNRIPGMSQRMEELHVPWPALSGDDLLNLVALFTTYQYYLTNVGQPGRPDVGERLLETKGCRECHAVESDDELVGPSLHQFAGGRSAMLVAQAMWNHSAEMQRMVEKKKVARPAFREREMADLMAFLATAGKPEGTVTAYLDPGSPARGAARFHSLQCDHCHALHGRGGIRDVRGGEAPPPDLASDDHTPVRDYTEVAALMWNHSVPMLARMEAEGIQMHPLKDNDLADLISFLFFVNFMDQPGDVTRGREVFESRGCVSCHLTERGAASTGPNLAETRVGGARTAQDVMAAMWRAAPGMRRAMLQRGIEWPILKPDEVRHLVAYLLLVGGNAPAEPADPSKSNRDGVRETEKPGATADAGKEAPKPGDQAERSKGRE